MRAHVFHRPVISVLAATLGLVLASAASGVPAYSPGADGLGDPYYPLDGNGGYDVGHYDLAIDYDPSTHALAGVATIGAVALQGLSRFNLDFDGLTIRSIKVNGANARWSRHQGEVTVTPAYGINQGASFTTVVRYDGVPTPIPEFGGVGVIPSDDGALILGEPHVATAWFPANDHPSDKASYTVHVTVPEGLEVIGNGALVGTHTAAHRTTWTWDEPDPMASYLATASIGQFDISSYTRAGLTYWDALDPDLSTSVVPQPTSGSGYAWSQPTSFDGASYKRLSRVVTVPAAGGTLSFQVDRSTEEAFDYLFVEARAVGTDEWTTLPDANGHTSQDTGWSCPWWHFDHPFLAHYQTDNGDGSCAPSGTTGEWWAATGASDGWESWSLDLAPYAGTSVELTVTMASDGGFQERGVFLDELTSPSGTVSFEAGPNRLGGWTVSGPPEGSPPNENDWIATSPDKVDIPTVGDFVRETFAWQPEMIRFLSTVFGPYPFATAGGVVDDSGPLFSLENQTRPVYSRSRFEDGPNEDVVVHEIAHQWYGDSVAVAHWKDIWLNEGFATYAQWLWAEHRGWASAQDIFGFFYEDIPADDSFWDLTIGDPGAGSEFEGAVYIRGAMTLQVLRDTVGDPDFFAILQAWAAQHGGGNGSVNQFMALAEQISGQQLDSLFDTWLFTAGKPDLGAAAAAAAKSGGDREAAAKIAHKSLSRID